MTSNRPFLLTLSLSFLFIPFLLLPLGTEALAQAPGITLGPWQETAVFVDGGHRSHPLPSFAVGPYFYVHTKTNGGASDRVVYYGKQQEDGSLSSWSVAQPDHGGGPHGFTAVATDTTAYHFRNGHIAQFVIDPVNGRISDIILLEDSDYREAFSGNRYVWDTAVYVPYATGKSYIYHLGGFDFSSYSYGVDDIHYTTTPIVQENAYFQRIEGTVAPTKNPNKAAFYRTPGQSTAGYIYMGDRFTSKIYRSYVKQDNPGAQQAWIDSGNLPIGNGNNLGDMFVIEDSLFVIRGSKVFQSLINSNDGSLSAWDDSPPDLPEAQIDVNWHQDNTEGASYGIIGDYVYVTGPKKVYYAEIQGRRLITFFPLVE